MRGHDITRDDIIRDGMLPSQRMRKQTACMLASATFGAVALWALLWMVGAAAQGILSLLHMGCFAAGILMSLTMADIAGDA